MSTDQTNKNSAKKSFIKIDNTIYNLKYVKMIKCTDTECDLTMANTKAGHGASGYRSISEAYNDIVYTCAKKKDRECYNKIYTFLQEHE